jgi:hemerythrin
MSFLRRLLGWFLRAGLFGSSGNEKDFINRIKKKDIKYIINQGVPTINPPELPEARPWRVPYIAEGFEIASLLLKDPEALMNLLLATSETYDIINTKGDGATVVRAIAEYSRRSPSTIYYMTSVPEADVEIRALAAGGYVTALYLEVGPEAYSGAKAYEVLETKYWDDVVLTVTQLRDHLLRWSDAELSVFVKGLDNQHKYLVNTLNSLYRATVLGEADRVISTILGRLVDYTKFHFRSEEILMEKYNYPQDRYLRHVREHQSFVAATQKFREKYEAGEADLTLDVFKFLATWVRNHVAGTDRDYGRYFLKIGVANYYPKTEATS